MMMHTLLEQLYQGRNVSHNDMEQGISKIIQGEVSDIEVAALLVALKIKGESSEEIAGAAKALRQHALSFDRPEGIVVDTCGTGGDGMGTINISTMVGLVAAECGIRVAKHGNRSVSSKSGSSDILQAFGMKPDASPEQSALSLRQENFCFLFAPQYHAGVRHAMPARTQLQSRTLFNLIGPLSNPASPDIQLLGVYLPELVPIMAEALRAIGCRRAMVVHGSGLDEIALHGPTQVAYLNDGHIDEYQLNPDDAGLPVTDIAQLQIEQPAAIAEALQKVLRGRGKLAHLHAIAMNTAAVLLMADKVSSLKEGAELAIETLQSGRVGERLERVTELSHG